jgi:multidrug resistance protein, MATE family
MNRDRPILRLALPSVAASLSVPIIGFADTILVGHLDKVAMLGAVSVGAVVFDVIFWGLGFFRMGTTALVAQAWGAKDLAACRSILIQSGATALLLGLVLVSVRDLVGSIGFGIAGPTDEVAYWGRQYLDVRILGAPLVLLTFVLTGYLRGCGDAMSPLWITIGVNLINVGLDYALIYGQWGAPELGVVGAAWASVAASGFGAVLGVWFLLRRHQGVVRHKGRMDLKYSLRILSTNGYLFGRTACLLFTQFFGMAMVARMGEVPLAAHAVAWQIWSVVSYFVDGFAHAAETLVGNAIGARDPGEAKAFGRRCMVWGMGIGLAFGIAYLAALTPIAGFFTDHAPVVAQVVGLGLLLTLIQPLSGVVYILDGILIGANDTRFLFLAMAVGAFVVYLPSVLGLTYLYSTGLFGIWLAYNVLMLSRFTILLARFLGDRWLARAGHFA